LDQENWAVHDEEHMILRFILSKIKPFSEMHALLTPSPIFPPPPPSLSAVMRVHEVDLSGCRLTLSAQASIIT